MTIAIALSGGGARGDFELGAVRYLYEQGIRPNVLCGTSVGSINAIKLAEGENVNQPNQGLSGLGAIWKSLRTNSDMYVEELWLTDPRMDQRLANYLRGKSSSLSINGPSQGGPWGILQGIIDLAQQMSFLASDGVAILNSIDIILSRARGIFNLSPVSARLSTQLDLQAIQAWANAGGKMRLTLVGLESGRLRYVTETGHLIERDGSPVMDPSAVAPECASLAADLRTLEQKVAEKQDEIAGLQNDLQSAAPGEKAGLVKQIKQANKDLGDLMRQADQQHRGLQACALQGYRI